MKHIMYHILKDGWSSLYPNVNRMRGKDRVMDWIGEMEYGSSYDPKTTHLHGKWCGLPGCFASSVAPQGPEIKSSFSSHIMFRMGQHKSTRVMVCSMTPV
uniref:Uncharacterized protein n=1 Tax=Compsopogon caeruleus TaxID=31354 RepID=A0A6T6C5D7_9RHOD|mmetsp:Transcript_17230/g.35793  ORF Transcript_17230/g.35793 Transcript_17230/m.35793 type:complete len:100 (+) Transcript_17230:144-443(+)